MINRRYDDAYVRDVLVRLASAPTDVPLGRFEIDPTDPKITHFVHDVVRPELDRLGVEHIESDELNNLVCRIGSGNGPRLLLMTYTTAQHGNYTTPELEGRLTSGRAYGFDEDCVFGKGTSQSKGAMASALGTLKILKDEGVRLRGTLIFVVNAESESSHRCSVRIIDGHGIRAEHGIVAIGCPIITLGNRGRVDIIVTVKGEVAHSSQPQLGKNAIWGAYEALGRIRALHQRLTKHDPRLGHEQLEPYRLAFTPVAPHTIPDVARFTLDRRLLPGTDVDEAVDDVRRALADLGPYQVTVEKSVHHLPAEVPADAPIVSALSDAYAAVTGARPQAGYVGYTFDAGYACSRGIPTVMFGPTFHAGRVHGSEIVATEFVPLSQVHTFTKVYAHTILSLLS
jgi:acetylornithine deacetylase/succinyl-diaminopimelate desuccinylase-like protein